MSRRRILVATEDTLGHKRAGPAIRAWEIAAALAGEHDVRLVTTQRCELSHPAFEAKAVTEEELRAEVDWCEVAVVQGWVTHRCPAILASDRIVVVDAYDPMHLEQLEQGKEQADEFGRWAAVRDAGSVLTAQLRRADFVVCASEEQRHLWLGQLAAIGRLNPGTYDVDPTLRSLIDVAPFGIGVDRPAPVGEGLRARFGIGADDPVLLWGGGVYNWFDPLTLLRAVDQVRRRVPDVRLVFMGMRHPNPGVPTMRMAIETERLAAELGLLDLHVFFNRDWVGYDDRQAILLESTIGVSTHLDHVETEFSYRTRVLDYFWAGLPVVVTGGDAVSALVERHELGRTVPAGDVGALAGAIEDLVTDPELQARCRQHLEELRPSLEWPVALAPLTRFCRDARRAPDLVDAQAVAWAGLPIFGTGWRADIQRARRYLREGGPGLVSRQVLRRLRRLAGRPAPPS